MEFADGCGSSLLLAEYAEDEIADAEFEAQRQPSENIRLHSKEELLYFRIFQRYFNTLGIHKTVGKWRGTCPGDGFAN